MKYESFQYEMSAGISSQLPPCTMPEIAFSGRSNVGKSSLLNRLVNRKNLARVSGVPGKTVTINFFKGDGCRFTDLPGYGYAKVSREERARWAELLEAYFRQKRDIRLVIQLMDMRHEPTSDDCDMMAFLAHHQIPFMVALTKCDKLNRTQREEQMMAHCRVITQYGAIPVVAFSALKGEGVMELRNLIEKSLS